MVRQTRLPDRRHLTKAAEQFGVKPREAALLVATAPDRNNGGAINSINAAIQEFTRERVSPKWAVTRNNLDHALEVLAQRTKARRRRMRRTSSRRARQSAA